MPLSLETYILPYIIKTNCRRRYVELALSKCEGQQHSRQAVTGCFPLTAGQGDNSDITEQNLLQKHLELSRSAERKTGQ